MLFRSRVGDFSQTINYLGVNGVGQTIKVGGRNYVDPLGNTPFSGTIFDPNTTQSVTCPALVGGVAPNCTVGTTVPTRTAFVGNQIPLSRFDPVAKNVMALVPLPTGTNARPSGGTAVGKKLPQRWQKSTA